MTNCTSRYNNKDGRISYIKSILIHTTPSNLKKNQFQYLYIKESNKCLSNWSLLLFFFNFLYIMTAMIHITLIIFIYSYIRYNRVVYYHNISQRGCWKLSGLHGPCICSYLLICCLLCQILEWKPMCHKNTLLVSCMWYVIHVFIMMQFWNWYN